ncbi:Catechol 1,2-dioxygenase 1 [compost metagenome]
MHSKKLICLLGISILLGSCGEPSKSKAQTSSKSEPDSLLGGPCEGCEAIYEYGSRNLLAVDTLPDFSANSPKLKVTGTVFKNDGKTPAGGVILYIYHTNRKGIYPKKGGETDWSRRHGYIRGWIKTNNNGKYTFYTFRPAHYPNSSIPEHIHIIVKEPERKEYYLDDFLFDDDPLLTKEKRQRLQNRGGSGVGLPKSQDGILTFNRNILLGMNIPNYR